MTSVNQYPEYKQSGADWIGLIPTHWNVVPSKWLFGLRSERPVIHDIHLMASQKHGVISQAQFMVENNQRVVQTIVGGDTMKKIRRNDFLIHLRSFQGGIEWSANDGKVSPAYTVLKPKNGVVPRFFHYLLKSTGYIQELRSTTNQLRDGQSMTYAQFAMVPLLEIPEAEQAALVEFLDHEIAKIDELIAKQERLIELLAEKRQAIISQAVTKGIDPSFPTKPSGTPWIGDIPEHWSIGRIKDSVDAASNGTWGSEPGENELDVWCVRVADFERRSQRVGRDKTTFRSVTRDDLTRRRVCRGDLLLEKSGGGEKSPVGFVVEYDHDDIAVCSNFVAVLRMSAGMHPKFWKYVHASNYSHRITERSIKQSTGIQNLDQASYFNEPVGVPPASEQAEIAEHLEIKCAVIDSASDTAQRAVILLQERRSALISAAVTGKIDVRGEAA